MKVLVIDAKIAGISGDMLLASLLDLTGSEQVLEEIGEAIRSLSCCRGFSYSFVDVDAGGISGRRLSLEIDEERAVDAGILQKTLGDLSDRFLSTKKGKSKARQILEDLIQAETRIHRGEVFHLHEIASLDTVFDILGSLMILERHRFLEGTIYGTPPALGGGEALMAHGQVSVPAPATLAILAAHHIPVSSVPVPVELTTPTGAALFANLTQEVMDPYPAMVPHHVGYGAGIRRIEGRPNVLRTVEGEVLHGPQDTAIVLETNLDDATGEVLGYTIQRMMEEGALDVYVTPALGKKNRPVHTVSVITSRERHLHLLQVLMEETGTLGVRVLETQKMVAERKEEHVRVKLGGQDYIVTVKTSWIGDTFLRGKPEFDEIRRIAQEIQWPVRAVMEEVQRQITAPRD